MSREWKPGDVAYYGTGSSPDRMFLTAHDWIDTDGEDRDPSLSHLRPLVVIDPENREQVERLAEAFDRAQKDADPDYWERAEVYQSDDEERGIWQATLREFANPTPPMPEEPTGLGAVVEDADGNQYVRVDRGAIQWFTLHAEGNAGRCDWVRWSDIPATRVLSEGVTL